MRKLFTSESVTEGHPDKVCDQISDAVLDYFLAHDEFARVACETMVKGNTLIFAGELTTSYTENVLCSEIVGPVLKQIGYNPTAFQMESLVSRQSPDIALGVDADGAGDQGMMFGYACNETEELMPLPISLAHKLTRRLTEVRKNGTLTYLKPDGKAQVTIEYDDEKPIRVDTVVLSTQHDEGIDLDQMRSEVKSEIIEHVIPIHLIDENTKILINPTGRFVIGGPEADAGLTGRKIIVDTYGGYARHGGGAFSGKDPTKVDRSAAYAARFIAKNLVANGFAERCEVQLAYAIGVAEPVSIRVDTFGTGTYDDEMLANMVKDKIDLTPKGIIEKFQLRKPIYLPTAAYGHFGRDEFPWEKVEEWN